MRIVISLALSLIIYIGIVFFLLFFLFPKKQQEKKVYVHTAIIAKKANINKHSQNTKKINKSSVSKITKTNKVKKSGSKTNVTRGGKDIGFNDIFKNVDYNVETKKTVQKKQLDMSRLKGIERNLKKIKKISFQVNFVQNGGQKLTKEEIDDIISKKLSSIWDKVSILPVDYAKINIQNYNGTVSVNILESNLPTSRQNELINMIKNVKFNKNFNITVLFQSKVNDD